MSEEELESLDTKKKPKQNKKNLSLSKKKNQKNTKKKEQNNQYSNERKINKTKPVFCTLHFNFKEVKKGKIIIGNHSIPNKSYNEIIK